MIGNSSSVELNEKLHRTAYSVQQKQNVTRSDSTCMSQVRAAGEDAWLGGPAPENPALDGADTEDGGAGGRLQLGGVSDAGRGLLSSGEGSKALSTGALPPRPF